MSVVLVAFAAAVFRWFSVRVASPRARMNGYVLAGGLLVAAVLIPLPPDGGLTHPWLPLCMSVVLVAFTLLAGGYAPRARERSAPGVGSPA